METSSSAPRMTPRGMVTIAVAPPTAHHSAPTATGTLKATSSPNVTKKTRYVAANADPC